MHELSIAQNIISIVEQELAKREVQSKVQKIFFNAGRMNAIIPDSLIFGFNTLKKETKLLHEAKLEINETPLILKCRKCGKDFEIDEPVFVCNFCGSTDIEVVSGKDMYIESIELEDEITGG